MLKVAAVLLVIGGAVTYWGAGEAAATWMRGGALFDSADGARPAYRHAVVERGDVLSSVAATGALAPVATVLVGSQVSGQVKEIYADFNQEVRRGDPIALIDPISFEIAVAQAEAELDVARAAAAAQRSMIERLVAAVETARFDHEAARAKSETARIKAKDAAAEAKRRQALATSISTAERERAELAHQAAVSEARSMEALEGAKRSLVEAAEADVRAARSQLVNLEAMVRQREAALRHVEIELERTVIRAPVDGVVIQRSIEAGQTVATALEAPTLFTIAQDLRDMQVNAAIDESEIGRILPGQTVEFTVDAHAGRRFTGTVAQIRKSPQTVQNVVTYTVVVKAPNPDLLLLPGMTASARFIIAASTDVLKVPNAALRFRLEGTVLAAGQHQVWLEQDRVFQPVLVRVGLTDGSHTEVSGEGLQEGGRVAIGIEAVKEPPSAAKRLIGVF